jgi:hypothetical protein
MEMPSINETPSEVYDTWIRELTAVKQKLADELYSVTAEINAAEQKKQNALKPSVPESLVEHIAEQVQASVDAFFDAAVDDNAILDMFDIELSMGYDNKVEICSIDLSSLNLNVEDFVVAAFEDMCVIKTSTDVSALES